MLKLAEMAVSEGRLINAAFYYRAYEVPFNNAFLPVIRLQPVAKEKRARLFCTADLTPLKKNCIP